MLLKEVLEKCWRSAAELLDRSGEYAQVKQESLLG